jgi:hypothetical protein
MESAQRNRPLTVRLRGVATEVRPGDMVTFAARRNTVLSGVVLGPSPRATQVRVHVAAAPNSRWLGTWKVGTVASISGPTPASLRALDRARADAVASRSRRRTAIGAAISPLLDRLIACLAEGRPIERSDPGHWGEVVRVVAFDRENARAAYVGPSGRKAWIRADRLRPGKAPERPADPSPIHDLLANLPRFLTEEPPDA